ncbi:MAG: LptF/LptG family permease [Rhizobiaceae bacterium]|nr:LptF/LptG family permease [Rhizobiaceae bacterium]
MGLTLIERYVLKKSALAVAVATAALIAVLWVVRAVQQVDVLLNKGQGIVAYLKMTTLGVPTLTAAIIPIALLIGLIQTINALNKDSELVVMHASGASRSVLLKPFILLALFVSLIVMNLHLWVAPLSMQTLRTYVTNMRADMVSVVIQEGRFRNVGQGMLFHVASRAPGGVLKGILIHDNRDPKQTFTYLAKEGTVSEIDDRAYLILNGGQIHRQDSKEGGISIIKFNSYAFNLSDLTGGQTVHRQSQMELSTYELFFPDKNDALYKSRPGYFRAELHTRLTGGLYPIMVALMLLTFIGNPTSHRQGQVIVTAAACIAIVSVRGLTVWGEGVLRTNPSITYLIWGVPMAQIAYSSILLATDNNAMPAGLLARLEIFLNRVGLLLEPLRQRFLGERLAVEEPS